ncbi:MAG: hypothetical protein ACQET8_17295 [Bacillota bacterium]
MKLTLKEKLLNFLPAKMLECSKCPDGYKMKRGRIRHSRVRWNGPYCAKCGSKMAS